MEALGEKAVNNGYRLACQVKILGDLRVYVPPESLSTAQRLQIEERAVGITPVPPVVPYPIKVPPAELNDLRADAVRLRDALREQHGISPVSLDVEVLRQIPHQLREYGWQGTAHIRVCGARELVRFGSPGERPLGLAVDVGTTKIAAYLVDITSGQTLAADGMVNPQVAFGEDVMARIAYAMKGEREARELQEAVSQAVNELAQRLCAKIGLGVEEVVEAVVVGNTAMHHLFLGLPVAQLGTAPYVPAEQEAMDLKAREVGLHLASGAYVHLLPNIAGFIGADHVAMLLATRIPEAEGVVLGLDIGTNTEVVLRANGRLITCSTASGPAFEGAHIRDGMRAAPGAIEAVWVGRDGRILWQTVGGGPPVGLCGSGVLDAVAVLRKLGVVDERGRMLSHPRVRSGRDGPEFVLVGAGESGHGRDIVITRRDIEAVQLAKGAIRAGIEVLMQEAGVKSQDIEKVIIAGAFGTYLDVRSILAIGMLPPVSVDKVEQVGNAAGQGAKMALVSLVERERACRIARQAEYVELTALGHFADVFSRAMFLE